MKVAQKSTPEARMRTGVKLGKQVREIRNFSTSRSNIIGSITHNARGAALVVHMESFSIVYSSANMEPAEETMAQFLMESSPHPQT